jgi:hypothetical protein
MGDLVNLRTSRKRAKRQQVGRDAAANRLLHGRPKAERQLAQARNEKAQRSLEQHRIEPGERE